MIGWALSFAFACLALAIAAAGWRLLNGPEATDRVLAIDTLYVLVVAIVVLLGLAVGTELYFEAALLVALLGFASTVALARYLMRGDVIE